MAMQFTTFDEAQTWYDLRQKIVALLREKGNTFDSKLGEAVSVADAASILTSYLYGPSQAGGHNTF